MAVTILDSMTHTAGSYPASFAVSAGSNRRAYVAALRSDGVVASPETTATLGGQSMTAILTASDVAGSLDVCVTIFEILEVGIAAMSGSVLSISGGGGTGQSAVYWSVQGAAQSALSNLSAVTTTGTSGSASIDRVADSMTFGVIIHDHATNLITGTSDPTATGNFNSTNMAVAYGGAADTARTAISMPWTHAFSRGNAQALFNVGPAATGPSITTITDPISDSISITLSEAAATVDTIEVTVGTRTETQSYTTADNITFVIASLARDSLPPIGTATVTLKAGATEITSTTVELDPRPGYTAWTGSSIDFTTNGLAYGYSGSLPVDGDILELSDAGNSTCDGTESASSWVLAQNDEKKVEARIWQASTELWGTATIFATAANRQLHGKGLQVETMTATSLSATSL